MTTSSILSRVCVGALAVVTLAGCRSQPMQRAENGMDNFKRGWVSRLRPSQENVDSVMIDPEPDKAAQIRGWGQSTFVYPSGVTMAYPTYGLNYEDRPRWLRNDYLMSLVTPGIMIYDVLAMPVYMVMEGPTARVEYHGARQPASMTLSPPLPQSPAPIVAAPTVTQEAPAPTAEEKPVETLAPAPTETK